MSAMDMMLNESDAVVTELAEEIGRVEAIKYMDKYNTCCVLLTGFESLVRATLATDRRLFISPLTNVSDMSN